MCSRSTRESSQAEKVPSTPLGISLPEHDLDLHSLEDDTDPEMLDELPMLPADAIEFSDPSEVDDLLTPRALSSHASIDQESTSVMRLSDDLLAAATRSWRDDHVTVETDAEETLKLLHHNDPSEATSTFSVPEDLLQRMRASHPSLTPDPSGIGDESTNEVRHDPSVFNSLPQAHEQGVGVIETIAFVDPYGRLVLPPQMLHVGPVQPGTRVRVRIELFERHDQHEP